MFSRTLVFFLALSCSAARAQVISDVTEDGLVRVPSSHKAGVYRLPDASFAQYRRVMLAPVSVEFRKNWDRKSLDRLNTGLKPSERQRIADDMALAFHHELDLTAPDAGSTPGTRSFVRERDETDSAPR